MGKKSKNQSEDKTILEFKSMKNEGSSGSDEIHVPVDSAEDETSEIEVVEAELEPEETEPEPEETELEKAQRQSREYLDSLQRLKAEFDNFRKRMAKEKQRSAELHQSIVIEAILPTLDSFDAAVQKTNSAQSNDVYQGMKLIHNGLINALEKLNVKKLDVIGKPFDPESAEALMTQPSSDVEPNTVIGEIAAGYSFKDRVLRPARVVVSAAPPENDKGETE